MAMKWYYWDTNIGQALACAESAEAAREHLLATLSAEDASRDELAEALKARPKVNVGRPIAVIAWHQ